MLADNVGYIKVDAFPEGKSEEIAAKIRELQKQGAKKLVLDLRNAASGEESEGIATANLFLDHGTITYLQGQKYPRQAFNADPGEGHHEAARGGAGESRHGGAGGNCGGGDSGERARRRGRRQDLRRRVGAETDRDAAMAPALILSVAKYYSPGGKAIQDAAVTPNVLIADAAG